MSEKVIAEVVLRASDGSSILDAKEGVTAANIAKYRVGKEVAEEASKKLEELGFEVLQVGPVSLTISGEKTLFERTFQTALESRSKDVMPSTVGDVEASYFGSTQPFTVPEQLSSLVADVTLPIPPELFP